MLFYGISRKHSVNREFKNYLIKNNSVVYKNLDVLEFEKYNYFYILKSTVLSRIGFLSNRLELLFNNGIDYYQLSTNPIYEEEAEKLELILLL